VGSGPHKCGRKKITAAGAGECGRIKPGFTRVEPRPGMVAVHAVPWTSVKSGAGDTILVRYYSGIEPCVVLDHVEVSYGEREVAVTVYEGAEPGSEDEPCPEIAMAKEVAVDLDEPLGGRKVVDGARR
jgi:hypothetical protein